MLRSLLFVPGDAESRLPKALQCGADAVIADLEDAVDPKRKAYARDNMDTYLSFETKVRRYVRINAIETDDFWADVEVIVRSGLDGIVLPKFNDVEDIRRLDWLIAHFERNRGLDAGAIEILPLIETASGAANLANLHGELPRVRRLTFGAVDLSQDLHLRIDRDETQLAQLRWSLVVSSRAAGLEAPIDTVFVNINDTENYIQSLRRASDLGFCGKLCIHPSQVAPANAAFLPSAEDIAKAEVILAAYATNEDAGALQVQGMMVDAPVVKWAESLIAARDKITDA